jgi:hypothetical protein
MSVTQIAASTKSSPTKSTPSQSLEQYGCGPVELSG